MDFLTIIGITLAAGVVVHLGFEKVVKRLVGKTETDLDDRILAAVRVPLFVTVLLIGGVIGIREIREIGEIREIINSGVVTVLAVLWGVRVVEIAGLVIVRGGKKLGYGRHFLLLCSNVSKIVVWSVVLLIVLSVWGINITPLLASAGIAGIALGLGAQETLSNIFSGIAIILDKPYKIRDYIVVQGVGRRGELRGKVTSIGMRSTRIRTRDNVDLTIPNSIMANSVIVNETGRNAALRVRIKVGVAYDSDVTKVEQVLLKAAYEVDEGKESIVSKKGMEPRVRFREFGDSALLYELLVWIAEPELKGRMVHYLNKAVLEALRREKIEIPFPQRDVHIKKS